MSDLERRIERLEAIVVDLFNRDDCSNLIRIVESELYSKGYCSISKSAAFRDMEWEREKDE